MRETACVIGALLSVGVPQRNTLPCIRTLTERRELTILVTATDFVGHVSRTVEFSVATLMRRYAVTVVALPLVRPASTLISLQRPIIAVQFVAIVVRAIDSPIATLMAWHAIATLAPPLLGGAPQPVIFGHVVKCVSLLPYFRARVA